MSTISVTTWTLEQTSPDDLRPAMAPNEHVRVQRAELPSADFSRFLYVSVGGDIRWTDRLGMTRDQWEDHLRTSGTETWVAYEKGTPAGYMEISARDGAETEILLFGLLPAFRGRRIGRYLLATGTARAWDLAQRWPGLPPTKRVFLYTSSKDGKFAMSNYQGRGFTLADTKVAAEANLTVPSPWPSA